MDKPLIIIDTLTNAMKAKDILFNNRISSYIKRVPTVKTNHGCSYGLYIPNKIDEAEAILKDKNIKIIKVIRGDGGNDIS